MSSAETSTETGFEQEEIQEMEEAISDFVTYQGIYPADIERADELNADHRVYLAGRAVARCSYADSAESILEYYEESLARAILTLHEEYSEALSQAQNLAAINA